MSAVMVAPPLIAAGPPGWIVLGVLSVVTVGVAVWAISNKADEAAGEEKTDCVQGCDEAESGKEAVAEPGEYPADPDKLAEKGYEETTHPKAGEKGVRRFKNPKTGDEVEFHKGKPGKPGWEGQDHYHRLNPGRTGKVDHYLDKNGRPVPKNSNPSHLEPKK